MCYPCTQCGRCGKFNEDSPLYTPSPEIPCLRCGGVVDRETGACLQCGHVAFLPAGSLDPITQAGPEAIEGEEGSLER